MKDFFKYMFATIVGIIITSILLLMLFFGIIGAMVAKTDQTVVVKSNSLLIINLNQEIIDRGSKNPIGSFDFMNFKPVPQLGLNDILKAIDNAAQDENIRGIFIETESIPAGAATLEEIRMALVKFKESGKFIISYSDVYGQKSYYLSSVSDKILLNPEGAIEWVGMRGEIMFFKDALQKLGVEVQIIRHGKFKSAIEPFILDKMSPENREQTLTYMGSIWNHWVNGISKARNISVDELNKLADNLTISNAKSAVKFGLADSLVYKDQVIDMLKELTDTKPEKDINSVSLAQYTKVKPTSKHKGFIKDKIAVVYASGSIITGDGEEGSIASERFGRAIRKARRDSTVKAIVLRINSGGGSALASEVIWREVKLAKGVKPVIVSMGDVAASGGYFIAAPADYILASPTTITGSIGVFGMIPNFKEGMNKKLGITVDVVKTNRNADFGSVFRPLTAEERAVYQLGVEDIYSTFIGHVAEGRNLTVEQVDEIGQGRVWSGVNAMDIKLIDEFGGLQRAIEIAAERAGLENYRISELPEQEDPFEAIIKQLTGGAKANILKNELGENYKYIERVKSIVTNRGIMARIPYDIELY